jgi:hypothetical protein
MDIDISSEWKVMVQDDLSAITSFNVSCLPNDS